jgi:hypothetical protein
MSDSRCRSFIIGAAAVQSHRRLFPSVHWRCLSTLIAFACAGDLGARCVATEPPIRIKVPEAQSNVQIQAPVNSTLEIRMARRPWLLEKLIKPKPQHATKKHLSHPPAVDPYPPSTVRITPRRSDQGWVNRGHEGRGTPAYADLQINRVPSNQTPSNRVPSNRVPSNQAPSNQAPIYRAPITQSPVYRAPFTQTPSNPTPVYQTPITQTPVHQAPNNQAPNNQALITQTPIDQTPILLAPIDQTPGR